MKMRTIHCLPWMLLLFAGQLFCFDIPENYLQKTDSLFNSSDDSPRTFVGAFRDENRNTVYYASTTKMLAYPADTLEKHLKEVRRYSEYFQFIRKSELVKDHPETTNKDVYFCVAKGGFAKALFLGCIDSAVTGVDGNRTIYFNKYHDSALNKRYYEKEKGLLKVGFHEFNMVFIIRKVSGNTSKVCLVSTVSPKMWIPNWLFRLTAYYLFPSVLSDLDNALKKEY